MQVASPLQVTNSSSPTTSQGTVGHSPGFGQERSAAGVGVGAVAAGGISVRVGGAPAMLQAGSRSTSIQVGAAAIAHPNRESKNQVLTYPSYAVSGSSSSSTPQKPCRHDMQSETYVPGASQSGGSTRQQHGSPPAQKPSASTPQKPVGGLIGASIALGLSQEVPNPDISRSGSYSDPHQRQHSPLCRASSFGGASAVPGSSTTCLLHRGSIPFHTQSQQQHCSAASVPSGNVLNTSMTGSVLSSGEPGGGGLGGGGDDTQSIYSQISSARNSSNAESSAWSRNSKGEVKELPLCKNDGNCEEVNQSKHQKKFAHTCRLDPCYHGSVRNHCRLFRHTPGQIVDNKGGVLPGGKQSITSPPMGTVVLSATSTPREGGLDGGGSQHGGGSVGSRSSHHRGSRRSRKKDNSSSLVSVSFPTISEDANNAERIRILHPDGSSNDIVGDWQSTKLHTLKRYLHQITGMPPGEQRLRALNEGFVAEMTDDISEVSSYGIRQGSTVAVTSNVDASSPPPGGATTSPPKPAAKMKNSQLVSPLKDPHGRNGSFTPVYLPSSADDSPATPTHTVVAGSHSCSNPHTGSHQVDHHPLVSNIVKPHTIVSSETCIQQPTTMKAARPLKPALDDL